MKYEAYNKRTITNETDYLKELEKVRQFGYALDMEEELGGVVCIGAPVFSYDAYPCGSIWLSGPKDRLPKEKIQLFASHLLESTRSVSLELGYK